ncbi:hypothetical protein B0T19DRAFT_71737 [Cercophora scortea]|uniref:Uncharacterized protein n=1 Tax=Cercophora scortea TaxID=314031 RepID=A0AAE0J6G5_9PEZI|nr:hypothetical protein B0T19DRAFT_71737 [Cercophora scortea]
MVSVSNPPSLKARQLLIRPDEGASHSQKPTGRWSCYLSLCTTRSYGEKRRRKKQEAGRRRKKQAREPWLKSGTWAWVGCSSHAAAAARSMHVSVSPNQTRATCVASISRLFLGRACHFSHGSAGGCSVIVELLGGLFVCYPRQPSGVGLSSSRVHRCRLVSWLVGRSACFLPLSLSLRHARQGNPTYTVLYTYKICTHVRFVWAVGCGLRVGGWTAN